MKERPILFNGVMVRAILAGQKTQTRRVIKPHFRNGDTVADINRWLEIGKEPLVGDKTPWLNVIDTDGQRININAQCPYGAPGDLLWVGETWAAFTRPTYEYGESDEIEGKISSDYLDHNAHPCLAYKADSLCWDTRWRASIHMPRWGSRITLRIKSLRVERAQDISEEDAKAEGVSRNWIDGDFKGFAGTRDYDEALDGWLRYGCGEDDIPCDTARDSFASLWDAIHGQTFPWQSNPWVWVVEFEVVK